MSVFLVACKSGLVYDVLNCLVIRCIPGEKTLPGTIEEGNCPINYFSNVASLNSRVQRIELSSDGP